MLLQTWVLFFRTNFLGLDIYYGELIYELVQQQPDYEIGNFFSEYISIRT